MPESHTTAPAAPAAASSATLIPQAPGTWALSGPWSVHSLGPLPQPPGSAGNVVLDGAALSAFDSAGAWVLQSWLGEQQTAPELPQWQADLDELERQLATKTIDLQGKLDLEGLVWEDPNRLAGPARAKVNDVVEAVFEIDLPGGNALSGEDVDKLIWVAPGH